MKYRKELVLSLSCFLLAFLFTLSWARKRDESLAARIAPEILRFHVLANSDNASDQQLKLEVRTLLLQSIYENLEENATKDETKLYITSHYADLENVAEEYMAEKGYDYSAHIELGYSYFPTKTYGDMVFPCGEYEAVRVLIGKGEGRNWWCVLYPQLCFIDGTYATVPDTSKETLQHLLPDDDYLALLKSDTPALKPTAKVHIKFKLAELFQKPAMQ